MSRYLVLAHQTAASERLIQEVTALSKKDPTSTFLLLVPATPAKLVLLRRRGGADGPAAERRAAEARAAFAAAGVELEDALVGAASPVEAVSDEMIRRPGYDAVVISTLPQEQSEWLRMDLPEVVRAQHAVPVIHVQATIAELERMQQMP